MISVIVLFMTLLTFNAHAVTVYNTPYTYAANIVRYAQTYQFVIGTPPKQKARLVNSRGYPLLPTAVHRTGSTTLNNLLKLAILQRVAETEGHIKPQHHSETVVACVLHYPLNVYVLTAKQKVLLLSKLRPFKGRKLYVEGYTDCKGGKKYNDKLANQRAEAVVAFLNEHGFKAVKLPSYGKYDTLKTAKQSRRVEVYVEK